VYLEALLELLGKEARVMYKYSRPTRKTPWYVLFIKYYFGNKVKFYEWEK
jgi:hypothetical protein